MVRNLGAGARRRVRDVSEVRSEERGEWWSGDVVGGRGAYFGGLSRRAVGEEREREGERERGVEYGRGVLALLGVLLEEVVDRESSSGEVSSGSR